MAITFKACSVPDCKGNAHSGAKGGRGFCSAHYQRLRKHGEPTLGATAHGAPRLWLERHSSHANDAECLIWPFTRSADGYAVLSDRSRGKGLKAYREMCRLAHGEPPSPKHQAAHNCGNGHFGCVNPKHLRWDTPKGNMADKVMHGRNNRGEKNPKAQLIEAQVREIRACSGVESVSSMSRRFGISRTSVRYIIERRNWAWLD